MSVGTKTLRGNVTIWAARPEAIADWTQPISKAEWDAAEAAGLIWHISRAVEDSYTLNGTGYQSESSMSVWDIDEIENPTFKEYEGSLDLFRNKPGTSDPNGYEEAVSLFEGLGVEWYLIDRVDKEQGAPVEVGDILSAYQFETDNGVDIADDNSMLMFGARFKPLGTVTPNKTVVA